MTEWLDLDGSTGEGGGQIVRSSLSLSALTSRPIRLSRMRAGREKPGLAAQHLTAVRAVADLCGADVRGDCLGSQDLEFRPTRAVAAGEYFWDVSKARHGGSAGSVTLVMQSVVFPLLFAPGRSRVVIRGGTHLPVSPSMDYILEVWLPAMKAMGADLDIVLSRAGWYPAGQGEIIIETRGRSFGALHGIRLSERGRLLRIRGRALTSKLQLNNVGGRMQQTARRLLDELGIASEVRSDDVEAVTPGAGIFLVAEYENCRAGFGRLGKRGVPAERVAEECVSELKRHVDSGAAIDEHLADQLILPGALAESPSDFSTQALSSKHLHTNAWVVGKFGLAAIEIEATSDRSTRVRILPRGLARDRAS